MKISYYELLGLIKKGKQPNMVIYDGTIYTWTSNSIYLDRTESSLKLNSCLTDIGSITEKNIEIIEDIKEDDKIKKIEKVGCNIDFMGNLIPIDTSSTNEIIIDKLNEIIGYINKELIEK